MIGQLDLLSPSQLLLQLFLFLVARHDRDATNRVREILWRSIVQFQMLLDLADCQGLSLCDCLFDSHQYQLVELTISFPALVAKLHLKFKPTIDAKKAIVCELLNFAAHHMDQNYHVVFVLHNKIKGTKLPHQRDALPGMMLNFQLCRKLTSHGFLPAKRALFLHACLLMLDIGHKVLSVALKGESLASVLHRLNLAYRDGSTSV